MDKIPPALQHKIDYINALDIPVEQKAKRIDIATLDYKTYCSKEVGDYFEGTVLEGVASFLDKHNKAIAYEWEKEQTYIDVWRDNFINDDKGLQPAKSPPHTPLVKSPKRDIKVSISGINPEHTFTNKDIAHILKGLNDSSYDDAPYQTHGGKGGSGFKASKVDVDAQRIKDNDESMRRFYAMWSPL